MQIEILITEAEKKTLDSLIDLMISFGLEHLLFRTNDLSFLNKNEYIIQGTFTNNQILEWYPDGCGYVKFKFTKLGLSLIKAHRPEVFEKLKPFFPFRSISEHSLPKINYKIIKEETTA